MWKRLALEWDPSSGFYMNEVTVGIPECPMCEEFRDPDYTRGILRCECLWGEVFGVCQSSEVGTHGEIEGLLVDMYSLILDADRTSDPHRLANLVDIILEVADQEIKKLYGNFR